ncbi:endonuclease domain-containing protein [Corynebacterium lujinxingii]|uniref:DUF559 domain-containing protein n=1 Tax=Corynebacterium lujinxingii TaxID=2763010 RepID=A0A7H0JXI2_9CORY|nr:DUF559 domain-containing protein [Corynebacterium lujinxingii]MBC3177811.1 DUF559 domain-containing protein [Corynebacterium lujinxingii]NNO09944.1 DUF559 domain-containing protein [Corynebacterium lujinxingii]QNP89748.1 DUF559 domain-containing protein [Corynebacterium lujinxingii]
MNDARRTQLRETIVDVRRISSTDTATHDRINNGELVQLTKSIYYDKAAWQQLKEHEQAFLRCYAAGCQSRKAVLIGCSAARLNGVWTFARDEPVTLAVPNGRPRSINKEWTGYEYRHRRLAERDIVHDGAVRYTDAICTAVDIARERGVREGVVAIDSVLSGHGDHLYQEILNRFEATITRMAGTKGIAQAREAVPLTTRLSESPYESLLRLIFDAHNVPYRPQVVIGRYRVDFLVGENIVVEVDGWLKYEEVPHEVLRRQREREDWLTENGYKVLRFYTKHFWGDEGELIRRVGNAWPAAERLLPVRVQPRLWAPKGPGRSVALPADLQDVVKFLYEQTPTMPNNWP